MCKSLKNQLLELILNKIKNPVLLFNNQMDSSNKTGLMELLNSFANESRQKKIVKKAEELYLMKSFKIKNMSPEQFSYNYDRIWQKYQSEEITTLSNDWHKNQRRLFLWYLVCYCEENKTTFEKIDKSGWEQMGELFFNKNPLFLKFQALTIEKNINRYKWTSQDEKILKKYVSELGSDSWNEISKSIFLYQQQGKFISPKQCRQRWFNHVCQQIKKGQWDIQQDLLILKLSIRIGKKWSQIARELKTNRTEHMVKNRYNSIINKKKTKKNENQENTVKKAILQIQKNIKALKQQKSLQTQAKVSPQFIGLKYRNQVVIRIKNNNESQTTNNGIILHKAQVQKNQKPFQGNKQVNIGQIVQNQSRVGGVKGVVQFEHNLQGVPGVITQLPQSATISITLTPGTYPPISPINNFQRNFQNWNYRLERKRPDGSSLFSPLVIASSPAASTPCLKYVPSSSTPFPISFNQNSLQFNQLYKSRQYDQDQEQKQEKQENQ